MNESPGISVIIVSYNSLHVLPACLDSVLNSAKNLDAPCQIIVVDNHSKDKTAKIIKPRYGQVDWIELDDNIGFGSACNRGEKKAKYSFLLLLNPDTIIEANTLSVMWNFQKEHPDMGLAGCRIRNSNNSLQLACRRSFPSPKTAFYRFTGLSRLFPQSKEFGKYNLTYLPENQVSEVDAISGSFMFVEKKLFQSLGGFDEEFFMYGEDLDLCYRAQKCGKKNYYTPQTNILHLKGESTKSKPITSLIHFYEAMVIFSRKHLELSFLPIWLFYLGAGILGGCNFLYNRWKKWPRWTMDLVIVNLVLGLVTIMYSRVMGFPHIYGSHPNLYVSWHLLNSALVFFLLGYLGDYGKYPSKLSNPFVMAALPFLAFLALGYFFYEISFSRIVFGISSFLSYLSLVGWRIYSSQGGFLLNRILASKKRVVLLGEGEAALKLREFILNGFLKNYELLGTVDKKNSQNSPEMSEIGEAIATVDEMGPWLEKLEINEIIIADGQNSYNLALEILSNGWNEGLPLKLLVGDPEPRSITLVDVNFTDEKIF